MATKYTSIFNFYTQPPPNSPTGSRSAGWSESVWLPGDNMAFTDASIVNLPVQRARLLPQGGSIIGLRLSQYQISGNRLVRQGSKSIDENRPGSARLEQDIPQMALQVNCTSLGKVNTSQLTITAIPDARVVGGSYTPTVDFSNSLNQYTNGLKAAGAGFMGVDHTQFISVIASIVNGVVTTDDVLPLVVVGSYIRINRVRTSLNQPLSGSFRVSAITGNSYTCPALVNVNADRGGTATRDVVVFCAYDTFAAKGVRPRKVGRPLNGYRGKSSR